MILLQAHWWQWYFPCHIDYQRFCRTTSRLYQSLSSWAMWVSKEKWEFLLGKMLWAHFRHVLTGQNSLSSVSTVKLRTKAEGREGYCHTAGKNCYFFSPITFHGHKFWGFFPHLFLISAFSSWLLSLVMKVSLRDMAEAKCPGLWVSGCCWPWGSPSRARHSCGGCGIPVWALSALGLQFRESGAFPNCWNSLRRR